MAEHWTLPLVQFELDALPPSCEFNLAAEDAARLFGVNNVGFGRILNFAAGHGCRALFRSGTLVFRKLPRRG